MNTSSARLLVRSIVVVGIAAACALLGSGIASAALPGEAPLVATIAPDDGVPSLTFSGVGADTAVTVTRDAAGRFDLSADRADLHGYIEIADRTSEAITVRVTDHGTTREHFSLDAGANLFFRP